MSIPCELFVAPDEVLAMRSVGWVRPLERPIERVRRNPFTGKRQTFRDRHPDPDSIPEHFEPYPLDGLARLQAPDLLPEHLAHLMELGELGHWDACPIYLGPGLDGECAAIYSVPAVLVTWLAGGPSGSALDAIGRWNYPGARRELVDAMSALAREALSRDALLCLYVPPWG